MSASDNPKEIDRQKKDDDKNAETDDSGSESDAFGGEDKTMMDEIDTVLPGAQPLSNLDVSQIGPCKYRVMSARNGGVTSYKVEVDTGSCECEDMEYNRDGAEMCAHLAKALLAHPARMTPQESSLWSVMQAQENIHTIQDQAEDLFEKLEGERIKQLSNGEHDDGDDGGSEEGDYGGGERVKYDSKPQGPSSQKPPVDAHEAADDLQAAYDEVVDDMQVEVYDGDVWVQTGRSTPDTLPGPGNVEVFSAFLQNPEQVVYDPDAAESGDSPGQWWKNRIDPIDVDEYIEEVLK